MFDNKADTENMPTTKLSDDDFEDGSANILNILTKTGLAKSRGEARRLVDQGGVSVDDAKVQEIGFAIEYETLKESPVIIKKGKKVFHKLTL